MGTGEDPAERASTPKAERKQPTLAELSARIDAMQTQIDDLTSEGESQRKVIDAQQETIKKLLGDRDEGVDSRSTLLLGALGLLAKDPFNSGAWDKFRTFLAAAQRVT